MPLASGFVHQAPGAEVAKHAPLYDTLKSVPAVRGDVAGRMELDVSVLGCGEHAVVGAIGGG